MANVTSICEELAALRRDATTTEELLRRIVELLNQQAGCRGYFCKIWGQRWSFWVGDEQLAFATEKIIIKPELGFCFERDENRLHTDEWQKVIATLQAVLRDLTIV